MDVDEVVQLRGHRGVLVLGLWWLSRTRSRRCSHGRCRGVPKPVAGSRASRCGAVMARLEADDDGVDDVVVDVLVSQAGKEQGIAVGVAMARAPARQGRAPTGGLVATQSREAVLPWCTSSVARLGTRPW